MNLDKLTAKQLHQRVLSHNWDEGDSLMLEIARHPKCDLGTALLIYWLAEPTYYFTHYADRTQVPSESLHQWDFLAEIERRTTEGFYRTSKFLFDPANFEGQDLTELHEGETLRRAIPKEMYGPRYSGTRKRPRKPSPKQIRQLASKRLHAFVAGHSWIDGISLLRDALDNKSCDVGTAAAIYWRCDPHSFDQYRSVKDVPLADRDLYRLMLKAERLITSGKLTRCRIPYDPRNDNGVDWTRDDHPDNPKRRRIPAKLLRPVVTVP